MKEIIKSEFEKKYNEMRLKDLAKELGVTPQTIIRMAKANGIKLKGQGNKHTKFKIIEG